jgi:hypothetical protein
MKLQVRTWLKYRDTDGKLVEKEQAGSPTVFQNSGYADLAEMQRELMHRFPHLLPRRIENGIAYDAGSVGESRSEVTLLPE